MVVVVVVLVGVVVFAWGGGNDSNGGNGGNGDGCGGGSICGCGDERGGGRSSLDLASKRAAQLDVVCFATNEAILSTSRFFEHSAVQEMLRSDPPSILGLVTILY